MTAILANLPTLLPLAALAILFLAARSVNRAFDADLRKVVSK